MPRVALLPLLLPTLTVPNSLATQTFPDPVQAVVEETCFDCHSSTRTKAGLNLDSFGALDLKQQLGLALQMRDRVLSREMPPFDHGELEAEEIAAVVDWVDGRLAAELPGLELDPGSVTMRRLSRFEYDRVIADLFGVVTAESANFPAAGLGYGFDNIGGAVSFSTLHAEKYLAAAVDVARQIVDVATRDGVYADTDRAFEVIDGNGNDRADGIELYTAGTLRAVFALPRPGKYRLVVGAFGDQAGDEPAKMVVDVGAGGSRMFEVPNRKSNDFEFEVDVDRERAQVEVSFVNDYYDPEFEDPARRDRNLTVETIELHGPLDRVAPDGAAWLVDADPGERKALRKRAVAIARALTSRAWRRPPTRAELKRLTDLAELSAADGSFGLGVQAMVEAVLASPHFLYRVDRPRSGKLDPYALATRLAFFVWSSTPDERLLDLAKRRDLHDEGVLEAEARRMLLDPRARALATNFAAQWLQLRNLEDHIPDPERFPEFDDELRRSMQRETELLFETVVRERLSAYALFDADFTFVDARLAAHYGVDGDFDASFARVAAPRPGGVAGHAGVLTVSSTATRTSPVKRGKWLLDNLLDAPPSPPEPGFDSFPDESVVEAAASLRAQLELHRRDARCAVCHVRMDGLGLALERFDAIGRRREQDDGRAIDASGQLPGGRVIEDLEGVASVLRDSPAVLRALARKLFVFAVGRDTTIDDRLALERMLRGLRGRDTTIEELIVGIVQLDAFQRVAPAPRGTKRDGGSGR